MAAKKSASTISSSASKTSAKKVDFETALEQLEALVNKLEAGEISLEASLQAFEEGVKLTRECQQQLTEAEQRVQMLVQQHASREIVVACLAFMVACGRSLLV